MRRRECIGLSTREGTKSWSTHLASSPLHGLLLFCWRFIEIGEIEISMLISRSRSKFWTIVTSRDPVYFAT